jgi:hypothetical protein
MRYNSIDFGKFMQDLVKMSLILGLVSQFYACQEEVKEEVDTQRNQFQRNITHALPDSLLTGSSYLSVYSQIYNETEHKTYNLTATVSIRNVNSRDTIYIDNAEYFNTRGHAIRKYFKKTVYLAPMETVEIVIAEKDKEGGTGANFHFDWRMKPSSNEPLFEAVMISSFGQGLSFTTQGKRIKTGR